MVSYTSFYHHAFVLTFGNYYLTLHLVSILYHFSPSISLPHNISSTVIVLQLYTFLLLFRPLLLSFIFLPLPSQYSASRPPTFAPSPPSLYTPSLLALSHAQSHHVAEVLITTTLGLSLSHFLFLPHTF